MVPSNRSESFKGNLLKISVSRMLVLGGEQLAFPFFSLYVLELGGSLSTIALINSIASIASVLAAPVGGYIADSKGRVKLLFFGTLGFSLSSIFFILAQNWVALAVGVFIQMLTRMYMPALNAILADSTSVGKRGRESALSDTITTCPSIFAPALIGFVADKLSITYAVKLGFCGLLVLSFVSACIRLSLKDTIVSDTKDTTLRDIPSLVYNSYEKLFSLLRGGVGNLKMIAVVCALVALLNGTTGPYWIVYATEVIRLTPGEWGIIISVQSLLRVLCLVPAGFLSDKIGSKTVILVSLVPLPLCSMCFIGSQSFTSTLAALVGITACSTLIAPASFTLFVNSTVRRSRGSAVAAIGRGSMGLVMGTTIFGGEGLLLLPAKLIGYHVGNLLYQSNRPYPWLLLSMGLVLVLVLNAVFIDEPKIAKESG